MRCGEEMTTSEKNVPIISDNAADIWNEHGNVLLFALITMATVEEAAAVVRDNNWGDRTVTPKYMRECYLGVTEQTKADFTKRCLGALRARQHTDINWKDDEMRAMRNDPKSGASFHNKYGGAPYIKGGTFSSRGGLPALPPMPIGGGQCDCMRGQLVPTIRAGARMGSNDTPGGKHMPRMAMQQGSAQRRNRGAPSSRATPKCTIY